MSTIVKFQTSIFLISNDIKSPRRKIVSKKKEKLSIVKTEDSLCNFLH